MQDGKRLCEALVQLLRSVSESQGEENSSTEESVPNKDTAWESLVWELLENPAQLVCIPDKRKRETLKSVIGCIWPEKDEADRQETREWIFQEMFGGYFTSIMLDLVDEYPRRAMELRPTLVGFDPQDPELEACFEEAVQAWLRGLNRASVILCCSAMEQLLSRRLYAIDPDLALELKRTGDRIVGVKNRQLREIIEVSFLRGVIDAVDKKKAHKLRKLRNDAVHGLRAVSEEDALDAIQSFQVLLEKVLEGVEE